MREKAAAQLAVGQAEGLVRAGRAFLTETLRNAWATVTGGAALSWEQRGLLWLASTQAARSELKCLVAALIEFADRPRRVRQKTPEDRVRGLHAAAAVVAQVEDQTLRSLCIKLVKTSVQIRQDFGAVGQIRA